MALSSHSGRARSAVALTFVCTVFVVGACPAQAGINVWTSHGPGGPVSECAIDPSTPTTLYAGSSGGVFKSTDGGSTWSTILPTYSVSALAIDPQTPETLYAGTSYISRFNGGVYGGGLSKSTDGGSTWARIFPTDGRSRSILRCPLQCMPPLRTVDRAHATAACSRALMGATPGALPA